jgi:hypothetical protein
LRKPSKRLLSDVTLLNELLAVLIQHCGEKGDNEGAVDTLKRIIRERDNAVSLLDRL